MTNEVLFREIDRYLSWPIWVSLASLLVMSFFLPFAGMLGGLFILGLLPLLGLFALAGLISAISRSRKRRAASMALLLAITCWPFLGTQSFAASIGRLGNIVRLFSEKSEFEAQFNGSPLGEKPLWAGDWSLFATNSTFVIYDASGRIALPERHDSWKSEDLKLFRFCAGRVTLIYGSYYRCDI